MNRIELVFRQRPVSQSELYRNIVKPARPEAAIEMPHSRNSRNDHSDDREGGARKALLPPSPSSIWPIVAISRIPIEPFQTTHSFLSVMPRAFMYEPAPRPRLFVRKGSRQLDRPRVHACSEPKARVERVTGRESCASRPRAFCRAARGVRNQIFILPLETGCRKVRGSGAQ